MKTLKEHKKLNIILIIVGILLILGILFTNKIRAATVYCDNCGEPMRYSGATYEEHTYQCTGRNCGNVSTKKGI